MYRVAVRRIVFASAPLLAFAGSASARPVLEAAEATVCAPIEVASAPYQEQVCYAEPAGYTACRWIRREHVVVMPADCVEPALGARADGTAVSRRVTK